MDTEWDKLCARVLITSNRTHGYLSQLGIDCGKVSKNTQRLMEVLEEEDNAFSKAKETIEVHLNERTEAITTSRNV